MKSKLGPAAATTATAHKVAIIFYTYGQKPSRIRSLSIAETPCHAENRLEARLHNQAARRGYKLVPLEHTARTFSIEVPQKIIEGTFRRSNLSAAAVGSISPRRGVERMPQDIQTERAGLKAYSFRPEVDDFLLDTTFSSEVLARKRKTVRDIITRHALLQAMAGNQGASNGFSLAVKRSRSRLQHCRKWALVRVSFGCGVDSSKL